MLSCIRVTVISGFVAFIAANHLSSRVDGTTTDCLPVGWWDRLFGVPCNMCGPYPCLSLIPFLLCGLATINLLYPLSPFKRHNLAPVARNEPPPPQPRSLVLEADCPRSNPYSIIFPYAGKYSVFHGACCTEGYSLGMLLGGKSVVLNISTR